MLHFLMEHSLLLKLVKSHLYIEDEDIRMLEQAIDVIDNELPPLNAFILPGGDRGAAVGHICRIFNIFHEA